MTQEQEIKGILVHFFREGTKGDYLDALNYAIKEIQQVKKCPIPDVVGRSEQLADSHTFEANDNFSGLCKHCKKGKLFHG